MSLRIIACAVLLILIPRLSLGQNCTVGKRCGNTCIARTDTCHVGSSSSGGGTRDGDVALPIALMLASAGLSLGALYFSDAFNANGPCANIEPHEVCWAKVGFWMMLTAGLGLLIAGIATMPGEQRATSFDGTGVGLSLIEF